MDLFFRIAFGCAWGAMVLVWAWGWRRSKPTSRTAKSLNSLTPYLPVLIGVALLRMHVLPESWIKEPLWPHPLALDSAGLAVTVLGAVFAIWSRVTLGRNWSSVPQVKEQHELVVKGPYRIVRHPIYTGLILAVAGTGLALDKGIGLFMVVLVFASYWLKSRVEAGVGASLASRRAVSNSPRRMVSGVLSSWEAWRVNSCTRWKELSSRAVMALKTSVRRSSSSPLPERGN